MNLILYVHQDASEKGDHFKRIIEQNFKKEETTTFRTFNAFEERLKQPHDYDKEIFILFADAKNRLNELLKLIDLMDGKRIIVILPDQSKATISSALKFFPRFFTPISDTYTDLCHVLTKMMDQEKNNINMNTGGIKDVSGS